MGVTIRTNQLSFRDENGNYIRTNAVLNEKTEDLVEELEDKCEEIVDSVSQNIVLVQGTQPTDAKNHVWVDTSTDETIIVPVIDDDTISGTDTWSSQKFSETLVELGNKIDPIVESWNEAGGYKDQIQAATVQAETMLNEISDTMETADENRRILMGETFTETGTKVTAQNSISYGYEIIVGDGNNSNSMTNTKTTTNNVAEIYVGKSYKIRIKDVPDNTKYNWQYKYDGDWRDTTSNTTSSTIFYVADDTHAKRIAYKFRCILNGKYYTEEFSFIDTSWKDISPEVSVSDSVVSIDDHPMGIVPDGLKYDVRVNGISVGHIPYSSTASERTLTLNSTIGSDDTLEVVPFIDVQMYGGTIAQDPDDPNVGMVTNSTLADIDKSLTISGCAADAKVVGDELSSVKSDFDKLLDSNKCSIQWYRGGCNENTGKWAGNSLYSVDTRTTMIHPSPMQMLEGDTIPCPNGYSVAIAIYKNWHNSDDFTFDSYVSRKEIPYTVRTNKSGYWFMPVYKTVNNDTLCDEKYSFKTAMFQLMRTITPMLSIASSYDSMARRVNALENQMETMARAMQSFTGGVLEKFDNISIVQTVKKNVDPDNASLFGIWLIRQANMDGMNGIPDSSGHAMLINIEQKSFYAASQFYIMVSGENAGTIYMRTKNKQSWSGVAWTTIGGASSEQV